MDGKVGPAILWGGAALAIIAGAITVAIGLSTPIGPAAFGWFAYQPLVGATFMPLGSAVTLSGVTIVGCVLCTLGLLGLSFLAGRATGRKRQ